MTPNSHPTLFRTVAIACLLMVGGLTTAPAFAPLAEAATGSVIASGELAAQELGICPEPDADNPGTLTCVVGDSQAIIPFLVAVAAGVVAGVITAVVIAVVVAAFDGSDSAPRGIQDYLENCAARGGTGTLQYFEDTNEWWGICNYGG